MKIYVEYSGLLLLIAVGLFLTETRSLAVGEGSIATPYLEEARGDLVKWREWGKAAFEEAKKRKIAVLLFIGADWCGSCKIMDKDIFRNERTAKKINDNFVPIKLDREMRPDLDFRYQTVIGDMEEVSGWPLTVLVDNDSKAFWGGSYLPLKGHIMNPSFEDVIDDAIEQYRTKYNEVIETKQYWFDKSLLAKETKSRKFLIPFKPSFSELIYARMTRDFDKDSGGFGGGLGPKVPNPAATEYLLDRFLRYGDTVALEMARRTLDKMGQGGIFDHIGGGFHRFSTDPKWYVPQFEKLVVINAQLLANYSNAFAVTANPYYLLTADRVATYLGGTLYDDKEGLFYLSQRGTNDPQAAGRYYTITNDEIDQEVPLKDARIFKQVFNIRKKPRDLIHDPDANVAYMSESLEINANKAGVPIADLSDSLKATMAILERLRAKKDKPAVERFFVSGYNALVVSALLEYAKVSGREWFATIALKTLDRLKERFGTKDGGMIHAAFPLGRETKSERFRWLNDQVYTAKACYDSFRFNGQIDDLLFARNLVELILARYIRKQDWFVFDIPLDAPVLPIETVATMPFHDSLVPSAQAMLAQILLAIDPFFPAKGYRTIASSILKARVTLTRSINSFQGNFATAVERYFDPPSLIFIKSEYARPNDRLTFAGKRVDLLYFKSTDPGLYGRNVPEVLVVALKKIGSDKSCRGLVFKNGKIGDGCLALIPTGKN